MTPSCPSSPPSTPTSKNIILGSAPAATRSNSSRPEPEAPVRNLLPSLLLVFQERRSLLILLSLTLLLFALFLSIPVWTTTGNSFLFQMGIYTLYDFLLFGLLAGLSALVLTLSLSYARMSFSLFGYAAVGTSTGTFAA